MMPELEWLKLDVLNAYENIVEFKAYYKENGKIAVLHEKSFFIEENGVWKYKDGELFNAKVERNEPCPCGSGKKFKKCCSNL
jgi:SEC-C motif-containing protein